MATLTVLKWDECLSVQLTFQLPVEIPGSVASRARSELTGSKCEWTRIWTIYNVDETNQRETSLAWSEASFGKSVGTIASVVAQFAKWLSLLFAFTRDRKPQKLTALAVCTLWDSYSVCSGDIQVRKFKRYKF